MPDEMHYPLCCSCRFCRDAPGELWAEIGGTGITVGGRTEEELARRTAVVLGDLLDALVEMVEEHSPPGLTKGERTYYMDETPKAFDVLLDMGLMERSGPYGRLTRHAPR